MADAHFKALDGLRGLLALAIVFFHMPVLGHHYEWPLVRHAYVFVDFFFVLSGFVIAYASQDQLQSFHDGQRFMVRRLGRVWPLHMAVLMAFVAIELSKLAALALGASSKFPPFEDKFSVDSLVANIALVQSFNIFDQLTWNGPSWSISTEFYTYVVFAAVTVMAGSLLVPAAAMIVAGSLAALAMLVPNIDTTYDFGMLRCLMGFFAGVLLFKQWSGRTTVEHATLTEILCVGLVVMFTVACGADKISLLTPVLFLLPLWVFAHQQGRVSKVLLSKPLQLLGALSYTIYITHDFLVMVTHRVAGIAEKLLKRDLTIEYTPLSGGESRGLVDLGSRFANDAVIVGFIAVLLVICLIANRYIERPAQRAANRLAAKLQS